MHKKLQSDPLLHQMREDESSVPYVHLRIKELLQEGISDEYQSLLEQSQLQANQYRLESKKLSECLNEVVLQLKESDEAKLREEAKSELK